MDELHHHVLPAAGGKVVDDSYHSGMFEAPEEPRLRLESLIVVWVGGLLECDLSAGLGIDGAVHGAHCPGRNQLDHLVAVVQGETEDLGGGSGLAH